MVDRNIAARSARATVEEFFKFWRTQDVDMAMTTVAGDAIWHLHLSDSTVPFGGPSVGREAIRANFFAILRDWDHLRFEPHVLSDDGDAVRYRVDFAYRYRQTGEDLIGSCRGLMRVAAGHIVFIDEYHDAALVDAFVRLAKSRPKAAPRAGPRTRP
jgi:ketosteroid isomerase-like protein